jgi:signal transduction histidine kinase
VSLDIQVTKQAELSFGPSLRVSLVTAAAYYLCAEAAFFVGTLSDKIFAPFWPPNVILFCALLFTPVRLWWLPIAAVFPAHELAEWSVGMPGQARLIAFATNSLIATANAATVLYFIGNTRWFAGLRNVSAYIFFTVFCCPAIVAFGGAFVQISIGGELSHYWKFWLDWYASNALGAAALGPFVVTLLSSRDHLSRLWPLNSSHLEAAAIIVGLVLTSLIGFRASGGFGSSGFTPMLRYLPVPLVLWSAARLGVAGASGSVLVVGAAILWRALNGATVFNFSDAEANVLALQMFLITLSIPALLLGAAIGEVQQAETNMRESVDRMALAATSANVGLWTYRIAPRDLWMTDHAAHMFDLPFGRRLTIADLYREIQRSDRDAGARIKDAVARLDRIDLEVRLHDNSGKERWINIRGQPHCGADGKPVEIAGSFTDVTMSKAAEKVAKTQQQEIAHLMRVSVVGQLAGGLAHELTQPLTAITANAQAGQLTLAREQPDLSELHEILDEVITEAKRAGAVIHGLRALLKSGELNFEEVDINALVTSTIRLIHSEMIDRRVKVELKLAPDLPPVPGDKVHLQQVLLNLFMNSLDAMEGVTETRRILSITTAADKPRTRVEIQISDRGIGLPVARGVDIFKPFFTTKKRGLGLGLPICASIVAAHRGTLTVDNEAKEGAMARLHLPAQALSLRNGYEKAS